MIRQNHVILSGEGRRWLAVTLCVLAALAFEAPIARGADSITETFQRALFEEEGNQNLDTAIKAYQEVIKRMDEQRKLAATAVFRLGECYRKLGKTNEAAAQYQRILADFGDQATLSSLSRQNLAGLGIGGVGPATTAKAGPGSGEPEAVRALGRQLVEERAALLQLTSLYSQLTNMSRGDLKRTLPTISPDALLQTLLEAETANQQKYTELKQTYASEHPEIKKAISSMKIIEEQIDERLDAILKGHAIKVRAAQARVEGLSKDLEEAKGAGEPSTASAVARAEQKRLLEQEIKLVEGQLKEAEKRFQAGMAPRSEAVEKEREILVLKRQLASLGEGPMTPATGGAAKTSPEAEEDKEIALLQGMIKDSPDLINARDKEGQTPLLRAAKLGQVKKVQFLLANKADINAKLGGSTPLHLAAENGHKAVVEALLKSGANAGALNDRRETPLHLAAEHGYRAVAEVLIENKAPMNAVDRRGTTPLHCTVSDGFSALAELLIAKGAEVNANRFDSGEEDYPYDTGVSRLRLQGTALHLAAYHGNTTMVSLLLSKKAGVDLANASGHTPLHFAAGRGHTAAAELLLKAGANVDAAPSMDTNPGWTPLHLAVQVNRKEIVGLLLKYKAKPEVKTGTHFEGESGFGWTPLLMAASKGYKDIAQVLLENKASPNAQAQNGATALWEAVIWHDQALAEMLLKGGADPNKRAGGREEATCLGKAVENRNQAMTELLLKYRADANLTNSYGSTPLHLIANEALRESRGPSGIPGARLPAVAMPGAASPDHPPRPPAARLLDLARLLIDHGADVGIRNSEGKTALNLISPSSRPATESQTGLTQLLREHGALEGVPEPAVHRTSIRAWRDGQWGASGIFVRNTNDLTRLTLFDALLEFYSSTSSSGGAFYRPNRGGTDVWSYDFPDFRRLEVRRPDSAGKYRRMALDLLDATGSVECGRNLDLEFGDVIVIPEREHALNEGALGMTSKEREQIAACLKRTVRLAVKGQSRDLPLGAGYACSLSRFLGRPDVMSALVSSSDLSRVTVRRRTKDDAVKAVTTEFMRLTVSNPTAGSDERTMEFKVDVSGFRRTTLPTSEDLLLRAGDEIEVPEKN